MDLAEALAVDGVDAVSVATPPHTHHDIVLEAVGAGKHVLCEKPFARDTAEAEAMLAAAEAAGVVHLLGAEFRWGPGQALLRRTVTSGQIGTPKLATFLLHIPLLADAGSEVPDWWGDAAQGGGWLGAHGSHVIDQIREMLGEIVAVQAALPLLSEHHWTAEDTYSVRFVTASGVDGILQGSAGDWGPITSIVRIAGSTGTAWSEGDAVNVADATGTRLVEIPADLEVAPPSPPPVDLMHTAYDFLHSTGLDFGPWTRMADTFRALIEGRETPADPAPATFADGVALMQVMDAIRRSAADRAMVAVDRG